MGVSFAADTDQSDSLQTADNVTAISSGDSDAVANTGNIDDALSLNEKGNDKVLSVNDKSEILSEDDEVGSFTDLNKLIKFSSDTLTLEKDFEFKEGIDDSFTDGIMITKSLTIDANGHTITGTNNRVFYVSSDDVVIKNLNIVNTGSDSISGSGIYWAGNNGNLINSKFINTTAYFGAVYWSGSNANIINVTFENGTAWSSGGFHCIGDNIYVINSTFKNCSNTNGWGAAITIQVITGKLYIKGCNFTECDSTKTSSTVTSIIHAQRNSYTIDRCIFTGNKCNSNQCGILGELNIVNCTNSIFADNDINRLCYARYATFDNCTIIGKGFIGAWANLLNVYNCKFYNQSGYSISPSGDAAGSNFINLTFYNCTNPIYLDCKFSVIDKCNFIKCTASKSPIYLNNANYTIITNCKFEDTTGVDSNAIYIKSTSYNNIDNNIYSASSNNIVGEVENFVVYDELFVKSEGVYTKNNVLVGDDLTWAAKNIFPGGTIYLEKGTYEFSASSVLYGNVVGNGAIINKGSFNLQQVGIKVENIIFNNSQNSLNLPKVSLTINNCTFTNISTSLSVITTATNDGHIYSNLIFTDIDVGDSYIFRVSEHGGVDNIKMNNVTSNLGVFGFDRLSNDISINNVNITNSSFKYFVGKIIIASTQQDNLKFSNINIIDSTIKSSFLLELSDEEPGYTVYVDGITIKNCDFTQNDCDYLFDVKEKVNTDLLIRKHYYSKVNVNNLNTANDFSIFRLSSGDLNLGDSSFINIETQGYLFNGDFIGSLTNVSLSNINIPTLISGSTAGTFDKLVFDDATFTSGTILTLNDNVQLINSKFTDVTGNVKINGNDVRVTNTTFENGKTVNTNDNAGAIELVDGNQTVIQYCNFTNNEANNGGAIYINNVTNSSYIMNCKFTGNTARNKGGAIYIETSIYYYIDDETNATLGTANPNNNLYKETGVKETMSIVWVSNSGSGSGSFEDPCSLADSLSKVSPYGSIMFKGLNGQYSYSTLNTLSFLKPGIKVYGNYSSTNNLAIVIDELAQGIEINNLIITGVTSTSAIIWDGVNGKITNCTFSSNAGDKVAYGSAIKVIADNLIITNTIFENNAANNDSYSYGGAVYCNASGLNLKDCTFDSNAVYGWGSHLYLDEEADNVLINGTRFTNGIITQGDGSAVYILSESNVTVCNSTFTGNHAVNGGAINVNSFLVGLKIYNNTFKSNEATNNGGAIAFTTNDISDLEMYKNIYESNTATNCGGAIYSNVGITESNSRFKSNEARDGSAIYVIGDKSVTLTDDTFENNIASGEGTVYLGSGVTLNPDALTFKDNTKTSTDVYFEGGIYTASEFYVSQTGTGTGMSETDPTTLATALQHISDGGKIILTGDLTIDAIVEITNKNIALVGNGNTITGNKRAFTISGSTVTFDNVTFGEFTTDDWVVYYDASSSGSVVNSTFNNNAHSLYISDLDAVSVVDNTFVCPSVSIDEIASPVSYHGTVTISGTFDDGTNRYSKHDINIKNNDEVINTASLTSSNTFSYSYEDLLNGNYEITLSVADDENTYIFDASRSFTVSQANIIYIGPSANGDGSGVDSSNLATWDTIGDKLASDGTVYFTDGSYTLSGKSITNGWTLTASDAGNVIIDGDGQANIFSIDTTGVTIEKLTLQNAVKPITGENTVTVTNSVLKDQLSLDEFNSEYKYGSAITIAGSFSPISLTSLTIFNDTTEIGSASITGSSYTLTTTTLGVGSYAVTTNKT